MSKEHSVYFILQEILLLFLMHSASFIPLLSLILIPFNEYNSVSLKEVIVPYFYLKRVRNFCFFSIVGLSMTL